MSGKRTKKTFLENIFSLRNDLEYKYICILGYTFKIELEKFLGPYVIKQRKKSGIINNKIVFSNYMGGNYGCNPKYITEELLKRKTPADIVWITRSDIPKDEFPSGVRCVQYASRNCYKELATAKIWVDNFHKNYFIKKGLTKDKNQVYIQTWHGSLGIKKIEKNVNVLNTNDPWLKVSEKNSKMTDYWISNSTFETNVYKEAFWDVKNILEYGHARNDVFFKDSTPLKEKVYKYFNLDLNKKFVLFVPSFREDENLTCFNMDYEKIRQSLCKKFGGEFEFGIRLHPRMLEYAKTLNGADDLINASDYPDIQELLVASDVVITDYSSCIFDFMLSRKPAFIYAEDIEKYDNERGFYYSLYDTPFPVATNNEEFIENIKNFDLEQYKIKVEEFLKDKGCMEDGHASERMASLIEVLISKKKA